MLLLHQVGSLKIGEVVRYTVTYTPSQDRILPPPEKLFVRLRNTSAVALRAAFVHGPYTLSIAAYPSNYDPNEKFQNPRTYGVPAFEPMVKAGGSWECELTVPEHTRQVAGTRFQRGITSDEHDASESASWIIEVSSQVIFSTSAAVGYEVVVARDKKSLNLSQSLPVIGGHAQVPQPGKVSDLQQSIGAHDGHHPAQQRGVFSRAVHVKVEDTATLWNTPALPGWDEAGPARIKDRAGKDKPVESVGNQSPEETKEEEKPRKQKKVHLVVLTHGLHSNLGADMLYMKESIDGAVRQAKIDAKTRKAKERAAKRDGQSHARRDEEAEEPKTAESNPQAQPPPEEQTTQNDESRDLGRDENDEDNVDEDDDDEEVIVRGYSGNATKTEKGIKYLGKRLARYVLSITYPDQPYMPIGKGTSEGIAQTLRTDHLEHDLQPTHKHSDIYVDRKMTSHHSQMRAYKITSISFIAHSLGGLVQTYAIAYIQKHSPQFFDLIKPINFIAMATPYLGLSNENPLYVKFALDFGLVGRTGQDLGLTWRAPTLARSGWGAIVSNLGEAAHKRVYGETQPESKPLLRILPTGPAHTALKKFRNRTVYSNVVNDGIVPLRTSCLLFLDWQGLGRVEKARRDAGLVETVVGFGWAELTGANLTAPRHKQQQHHQQQHHQQQHHQQHHQQQHHQQQHHQQQQKQQQLHDNDVVPGPATPGEEMLQVPQPTPDAVAEDERASIRSVASPYDETPAVETGEPSSNGPLAGFFNLFKSNEPPKSPTISQKQKKIYHMSQTTNAEESSLAPSENSPDLSKSPKVTSGQELDDDVLGGMTAPPRTTFFESAGDLLNPKIPDVTYLIDPSKRPRTIFHDRVYHPSDIPAPPLKKRNSSLIRRKTLTRLHSSAHRSVDSESSSPYSSIHHESSMKSTQDYDDTANTNPDKHPDEVIDSSSLRVEEKIARGYHRDLSWRKVLVKLEPDAHNNIVVRRMFANAYGWPVVKHLVDVHFSDSAVARTRDDEERRGERALDVNQPPDEHGGETKADSASNDDSSAAEGSSVKREEILEARDQVPDLPPLQESEAAGPHGLLRPGQPRCDSMTWSDHDWADSEYDSDGEHLGEGKGQEKGKEAEGRASPSWNWTEKIVGKGGANRAKSPVEGQPAPRGV